MTEEKRNHLKTWKGYILEDTPEPPRAEWNEDDIPDNERARRNGRYSGLQHETGRDEW